MLRWLHNPEDYRAHVGPRCLIVAPSGLNSLSDIMRNRYSTSHADMRNHQGSRSPKATRLTVISKASRGVDSRPSPLSSSSDSSVTRSLSSCREGGNLSLRLSVNHFYHFLSFPTLPAFSDIMRVTAVAVAVLSGLAQSQMLTSTRPAGWQPSQPDFPAVPLDPQTVFETTVSRVFVPGPGRPTWTWSTKVVTVTQPCTTTSTTTPCTTSTRKHKPTPCSTSKKPTTTPCTTSKKPTTTPCSTPKKPTTTPCSTDKKPTTTPCSTSKKPTTTPCSTSKKSTTTPCSTSKKSTTTPCSTSKKPTTTPCSTSKKPTTTPCTTSKKPTPTPCTTSTKKTTTPCVSSTSKKPTTTPCKSSSSSKKSSITHKPKTSSNLLLSLLLNPLRNLPRSPLNPRRSLLLNLQLNPLLSRPRILLPRLRRSLPPSRPPLETSPPRSPPLAAATSRHLSPSPVLSWSPPSSSKCPCDLTEDNSTKKPERGHREGYALLQSSY
ncbi:uncharacterized protein BDZ83DRAFT_100835 [Colletotrichum acutatum]|uniref:Uncharacterized protein n=1 Tax=Glomerella acutata TaxID=27357 RepID=A0AAD8XK15_GLOAC|nr:uncharacterized protein BDZ83DRAFT_100835 [Colletotrichum acutatum]KAK1728760.1 hypothetical protein BDZ83DRAFT_100835 [Colletotrichum acutatum]